MNEEELSQQLNELKAKLNKAMRQIAGFKEKNKILEAEYQSAKSREESMNELVMQLMERQRELNVMLNRANLMLNRTQEAMALTSMEMNEMVKALPEPKQAEWAQRVAKINELFKKTGIPDAELSTPNASTADLQQEESSEDIIEEAHHTSDRKEAIWRSKQVSQEFGKASEQPKDKIEQENFDNVEKNTIAEQNSSEKENKVSWWRRITGSA